jgi:hypothetical protein
MQGTWWCERHNYHSNTTTQLNDTMSHIVAGVKQKRYTHWSTAVVGASGPWLLLAVAEGTAGKVAGAWLGSCLQAAGPSVGAVACCRA